jgi:hypothetical protein
VSEVEHFALTRHRCACGATFERERTLRRHITNARRASAVPTVWQAAPAPRDGGGSKRTR